MTFSPFWRRYSLPFLYAYKPSEFSIRFKDKSKGVRTCLLSIKKQASPNALPRNEYKQYSHAVLVCTDTAQAVHRHIQNRWASCSFHPSESEFWRFRFLGRKQKTLSINVSHFSSPHHANIHFLPDMTLFFGSFFTFTSDWYKITVFPFTPYII